MGETEPTDKHDLARALAELGRRNRHHDVLRLLVQRLASAPGVTVADGVLVSDSHDSPFLCRFGSSGWEEGDALVSDTDTLIESLRSGGWASRLGPDGHERVAPLWLDGLPTGALRICGQLDEESHHSLEDAAALAGLTLENSNLRHSAARSITEVATVLSALIESRDSYTESHCVALAEMSVGIGIRLGLDDSRLTILNLAGHMHDVGKVSVPDAVLLKPGPLTDDEFAVMQSHASIGEEVLSRITHFSEVAPVVGQHHERFDGDGYPRGMSGEEILLEARILAVTDAFDAMTSSRPYRKALSEDVALEEIDAGAGSQFDPEIAHVFLQYLEGERAQWKRTS